MDDSDGLPRVLIGKEIISHNGMVQYSASYATDPTELFQTSTVFSQPGNWTIDFTIDTVNGQSVSVPAMHYGFIVSSSSTPQVTTLTGAVGDCIGTLEFTQNTSSGPVQTNSETTTLYNTSSPTSVTYASSTSIPTNSVFSAYTQDSKERIYFSTSSNPVVVGKPITLTIAVINTSKYNWAAEDGRITIGDGATTLWDQDFTSVIGVIPVTVTFPHSGLYQIPVTIWNVDFKGSAPQTVNLALEVVSPSDKIELNLISTPVTFSQTSSSSNQASISTSASQLSTETSKTPSVTFVSETLPSPQQSDQNSAIPLEAQPSIIPSWIKDTTNLWSQGQTKNDAFVIGMRYMIQNGLMDIPHDSKSVSNSSPQIPTWVKNNAGWWVNGQISDNDFVNGIQYMISKEIIKF